ncbi:ORF3 [torque teno Delphinidae virus 5]
MCRLRGNRAKQRAADLRVRNAVAGQRGGAIAPITQKAEASAPRRGSWPPFRWTRTQYRNWTPVLPTVREEMAPSVHKAATQTTATPTATGASPVSAAGAPATRIQTSFQGGFKEVIKLFGPIVSQIPTPLKPSPVPPISIFSFKL